MEAEGPPDPALGHCGRSHGGQGLQLDSLSINQPGITLDSGYIASNNGDVRDPGSEMTQPVGIQGAENSHGTLKQRSLEVERRDSTSHSTVTPARPLLHNTP